MNSGLVFLTLIAILVFTLGLLGLAAIFLLAHRCRISSDNMKASPTDHSTDPWQEAGRRQQ